PYSKSPCIAGAFFMAFKNGSMIFHLSSFIFHLSSFIFHLSSFIFHLSSSGLIGYQIRSSVTLITAQ
ncbi:hypothetical protein, partial [Acinetobacter indicus]|uniref:hypothetical protein n=1 Tax=Acinetobacter indicus TaxID=756892 RepID=UPI00257636C8